MEHLLIAIVPFYKYYTPLYSFCSIFCHTCDVKSKIFLLIFWYFSDVVLQLLSIKTPITLNFHQKTFTHTKRRNTQWKHSNFFNICLFSWSILIILFNWSVVYTSWIMWKLFTIKERGEFLLKWSKI